MYLHASFLDMFSLVECMSLVWALSVIVPAYFLGKLTEKLPRVFGDISSPGQVMCDLRWTKWH
jgi:hypothetical protein